MTEKIPFEKLNKMSLDDLKTLAHGYMEEAIKEKKVDMLFTIARNLTEGDQPRYRYSNRTPPMRLRVEDFSIHYQRPLLSESNFALSGNFERVTIISGGIQPFELASGRKMARLFTGEPHEVFDPSAKMRFVDHLKSYQEEINNQFYVPGKWEEVVPALYQKAIEKEQALKEERNEIERQEIISILTGKG